ncbi:MAG: tetratricopeptide repeat protein [Syntrophaceae bacterium]|nr:tetratricopeptide repeat protein [Syntrophaceae bacterium]
MKKIKKITTNVFVIVLSLTFLYSCTFIEKHTQKETKKTPAKSVETEKPRPRAPTPRIKETPREVPEATKETPREAPEAVKEEQEEGKTVPPVAPHKPSPQQQYYNLGMRLYSQDKYREAREAWQQVIKLDKNSALADKARENIKKVDQILKTLEKMSGK